MGAVLLKAMKLVDVLPMTINGRSGIREGTGREGNSHMTRLNVGLVCFCKTTDKLKLQVSFKLNFQLHDETVLCLHSG